MSRQKDKKDKKTKKHRAWISSQQLGPSFLRTRLDTFGRIPRCLGATSLSNFWWAELDYLIFSLTDLRLRRDWVGWSDWRRCLVGEDEGLWSEQPRWGTCNKEIQKLKKKCIIPRAYPGTKVLSIIVNGGVLRWAVDYHAIRMNSCTFCSHHECSFYGNTSFSPD